MMLLFSNYLAQGDNLGNNSGYVAVLFDTSVNNLLANPLGKSSLSLGLTMSFSGDVAENSFYVLRVS